VQSGGITVKAKRLASIMAEATVLKIDIEGQEFRVIPEQLDDMSEARAWIVEIHPGVGGDPADVTRAFRDRGYDLWWNAPTSGEFEPYADEPWTARTTLIARR
jgi:hypothetical protein